MHQQPKANRLGQLAALLVPFLVAGSAQALPALEPRPDPIPLFFSTGVVALGMNAVVSF